jgi:RNA polymerase sigma-70 factor (ECF subfamily)
VNDPEALRPLLFSIAYRMLGSVADAEDVVQEALVRYERLEEPAESPRAFLSTVVTRLAIDHLRSARARRETYVGAWLPEPILTDDRDDPAARAEQADTLSMAFLLLLERLSPVERAVFLLHDVFGYGFDEVARMVGRSEASARQLAVRARRHVEAEKPRFEASRRERDELAARFLAAVTEGDVETFAGLLAADVVVVGDGGGKAPQWSRPIAGAAQVTRLLEGLGRQIREFGVRLEPHEVNGQPGAVLRTAGGEITNVWTLEIAAGAVQALRSVINPDKLRHLGPVADVRSLLREHRTG